MFNKLQDVEKRYDGISVDLTNPSVISDQNKYRDLMREHKKLTPIIDEFKKYKASKKAFDEAKQMLDEGGLDKDFKDIVQMEYEETQENLKIIEQNLTLLLLPTDPNDDKNVIMEIRGGAGGDEANLFAARLYRMYSMYADKHKFKIEVISLNETGIGGIKEISFSIDGEGAYSRLKYEMGVHRVQRVPETESQGRVHTSTATVAVLPEVEEVEVEINPNDLQIDTYRSGGAGGQHVNVTDSAVRITHRPTGVVVECQDERSQHKNRDKAMKFLRAKLYDMMLQEQADEISQERKSQVGTGDRAERIRTYNFPQTRITDHRIGFTTHRLEEILDGELDELIDTLASADQAEKLKSGGESA